MSQKQANIPEEINHLFRHEYGKIVSVLTNTFGPSKLELAEDVVQEAMLEAIKQWSFKGIPDNPTGWIYNVAKFKAINILKRDEFKRKNDFEVAEHWRSQQTSAHNLNLVLTQEEIADDQLRMMFTCCHPSISSDSQVALILKTLCGFSISEIAGAFLTTEENINKRLVRSRKRIREANIPFEVPQGEELKPRLTAVIEAIYLLFNEGYHASDGNDVIRYELCEEAIRLSEIIATNPNITSRSNIYALLSLMSLNAARFKSRVDEFNNVIDLESQCRDDWDQELIKRGITYLELSAQQNEVSIYHVLAAISAHHSTAKNFQGTDWTSILTLYDTLVQFDDSPIVLLNRAVAVSKVYNAKRGLAEIEKIKRTEMLQSYLPYYTAKAELHFQNNEPHRAKSELEHALKLPIADNVKDLINNKLKKYLRKD